MSAAGIERGERRIPCGAAILALAVVAAACGRPAIVSDTTTIAPEARGYRALFKGESDGPDGRQRFRMAAVLASPDRLRLEFFGPVGGARLVVAASRGTVTAIVPPERAWDRGPAEAGGMERLIGVPLQPADLVALLTGRPMCREGEARQSVRTKPAATFGRTLSWYDVTCPPGDIRYDARCEERGGLLKSATVRTGISGAMILEVEYDDHVEGPGHRWPGRLVIRVAQRETTVTLRAVEGPFPGRVEDGLFAPRIPDRFERRPLLASLSAPGLLGPTADRE